MHILCKLLILVVHSNTVPHTGTAVFVGQFVKNAIASQNDKVVIFRNFECFNIRFAYNNIWIATAKFKFCFRIAESPWYRKTTRKYSDRSNDVICILVLSFLLSCGSWRHYASFFGVLAETLSCSCGLIDLPSSCKNSLIFIWIRRLVILTQWLNYCASVAWH